MNMNKTFESAQKSIQASAEKFTPAALQESLQPVMSNVKAWGELIQEQAQASQSVVAETFEAFKNVKEPQAAFAAMTSFSESLMELASKNIKNTVALSVAQFQGNVTSMEKNLPASEAMTSIANSMKDSAAKMESSVASSVNESAAAVKKARVA